MKISLTANNHTELSFPSLNIDLSLFFLINTQLRIGKLYINGWPAKQEKASQKGAVYHQVWQWSRLHDQLFKRKGMFPYFLHLRKRLYNSTLRAYTEELEAFDHCFSLPWSSGIVSSAKIDLKGNSPEYAGVPHFCTPSFYGSKFPKWCSSVQQDKYCSANAPQLVRRRRRQWVRQKSNRFRLAKQQLCTCITLFCTFLCCRCTATTWDCLISRFM